MARQYTSKLYIGQKVLVTFNAGSHPVEALVTKMDYDQGRVHVHPIGYKVRWAALPRAICNTAGQWLQFEQNQFTFKPTRTM